MSKEDNRKMTDHQKLIENFYTSFAEGNIAGMLACYHKDIVFQDAAFGTLKGERAKQMWTMLLSQKKEDTIISHSDIEANADAGKANWVAKYQYGDKKRKVVNNVHAQFRFQDGKIIEHIDHFDLWKWSKQALGGAGYLLGWSSFMRNKIQQTTNKRLDDFVKASQTVAS